jgi:integrase
MPKYTGNNDFADAKKFKDEFEEHLDNGTLPTEKSSWTVIQAAELWVQQHAAHLGSEKVKSNERSLLRQLLRRLGDHKLKTITIDDLKTYQAERHQEVGERAVNLELRILVNILKEANLWSAISKHYKPLKERESEIGQDLSLDELYKLEETAAQNPMWEVAYYAEVLAANTGMRGGEIKRIQLRDLNLEARRLSIRHAKTDAGVRLVELNQAAREAVSRLYVRAQTLGASEPRPFSSAGGPLATY